MALDGLILHSFDPVEGLKHDLLMFRGSNLSEMLNDAFFTDGQQHYIYGDSASILRPYLMVGYKDAHLTANQHTFNKRISEIWVFVEHAFKDVKQYFTHIYFAQKSKISVTPFALWYYAATILWNFRVCLHGCTPASSFGCEPPYLETYTQQMD